MPSYNYLALLALPFLVLLAPLPAQGDGPLAQSDVVAGNFGGHVDFPPGRGSLLLLRKSVAAGSRPLASQDVKPDVAAGAFGGRGDFPHA